MTEQAVSFITSEEEAKVREDRTDAPELFTLDSGQLPFERMGDAHFELLVADVYRSELEDEPEDWYDTVSRLNDGADQGRDVILFKDGNPVGVVQCKRLKKTLELEALIYEICKFFLYAHIRPQIASKPGTAFRYHVAVADAVSAKLFEFMQGTGEQRFENLRAEFEKKCGSVRSKSETLKNHPKLKGISKTELCKIVWQWVPHLQTQVLKKDSLSSMVAKHQALKRIYFQLESDSAAIIDVIRHYLESKGGALSGADEAYLQKVRTEYINRELRVGDQLNIGLIQGTDFIPFVQGMLAPEDGIFEQNFGNRPVILTAGSSAASHTQWHDINALVKAYPNPLVLVVGCGEVAGSVLLDWKKTDGMCFIEPPWRPAAAQKYKAGWCWVTDPSEDTIKCFVLVENEPKDEGYDRGNLSLRLAFNDLILWPTLGNDFINPIGKNNSQLRRIIASQAEDKLKRPNLILASQHITELKDFVKSLVSYHAQQLTSPIAVVAANSEQLRDCEMQLHSATGVFPAADSGGNTRSSPPTMQPPSRVMRRSTSGSLTLTLNWNATITLERVKGHRLQAGLVTDDLIPSALEFHELFDRYPPIDCVEAVKKELTLLNELVEQGGLKDSESFAYQARHGVTPEKAFTLDDLAASGKYVMKAFRALSYLKSHDSALWITEPGSKGHLQFSAHGLEEYNVLAWKNDEYRVRHMTTELHKWARDTTNHPHLVVFASADGRINDQKIGEPSTPGSERLDITAAPTERGSFTDVSMVNRVYVFPLDEVDSCYDEAEPTSVEDFIDHISTRRKHLDAQ